MSAEPVVLVEHRGPVLVITLNRPHVRNCIDGEMAREIASAVERLDGDERLRAGVITAAGQGFCAGMDLRTLSGGDSAFVEGRGFAGLVERPPVKPLVAAVEGFAMGGGLELALACDLIVAAAGSKLGIPEVKRSLLAVGGGLLRLPARVGRNVAMEMALTGEPIAAERAYELGLVNRLAHPGQALEVALALADAIVGNAPAAVAASKRIIVESDGWSAHDRWLRQEEVARPILDSDEVRAGAVTFAEKLETLWRVTDRAQEASR
jgi:enoyl-CoA hydratase